jgi:hypothetical protein
VFTFKFLKHFNVFGYNDTGMLEHLQRLQATTSSVNLCGLDCVPFNLPAVVGTAVGMGGGSASMINQSLSPRMTNTAMNASHGAPHIHGASHHHLLPHPVGINIGAGGGGGGGVVMTSPPQQTNGSSPSRAEIAQVKKGE